MERRSSALSSYVPRLLAERLARGPICEPELRCAPSAVLLTDIAGFTKTVADFTARGRGGLEELTRLFNQYFCGLVDLVDEFGGDVLSVAGDAFFATWPADAMEGGVRAAVARATACALAIQGRTAGGPFLTRAGVAAGDLQVGWFGGVDDKWEVLAAGSPLVDVAEAEHRAAAGTVLLAPSAAALASAAIDGRVAEGFTIADAMRAAPSRCGMRARAELDGAVLQPFMLRAVLDRIRAGHVDYLAEMRRLTVALAHIPALADTSAGAAARIHRIVRALQETSARLEGIFKIAIDSKGAVAVIVFGLPPLAHEDDAARGVEAAESLGARLRAMDLRCGVGVATGQAFCGAFGSDVRREYTVHGDVINLAARLMEASPGGAACDGETKRAASSRFTFAPPSSLGVKGRSEPIDVHRPSGRARRARRVDAPMVGRAAEREVLARHIDRTVRGAGGGLVVVEGEAGLGKSRLLADFMDRAESSGLRVLTAAADAIERAAPYFAWRRVFSAILGLDPTSDPDAIRRRVFERLASEPDLQRLAPLASAVLPIAIPDNDLTADMTGDVRTDNTNRLLARLLADACAAPTALVVEDAHWLDSMSWSLLTEALRQAPSMLVVVATRPMAEAADGRRLAGAADWLRLDVLPREDMLQLVQHRLGVPALPPPLAEFLHERVAGHPFFCEELLHSMIESGVVRVQDGQCVVSDLARVDLPTTVEGVITSRIDRLTVDEQLCIKVASVIGRSFSYETLRETYPVGDERVADRLGALTRKNLLIEEGAEGDRLFAFKHVITRDVAYGLMLLAQARPLHRSVAEWYERRYATELSPYFALLAHHWSRAGDEGRAVEYLEKAGQQALRGGAFREALQFFSDALTRSAAAGSDAPRDARWEKGLATAHYFLGDLERSRRHLEHAVARLDRPIPRAGAATGAALLGEAVRQAIHRLVGPRARARRTVDAVRFGEAVDCYKILGQIYYLDGAPAPQLTYLTLRGLNVGERVGPSADLARILANTGTLMGFVGVDQWADFYATRAIEMAAQEAQYAAGAYVWNIVTLKEAQRGNWDAARTANDRARALVVELGDFNLEAEVCVVRSRMNICEGDFKSAPAAWSRALALAERSGNAQIRCWALIDQMDTLLAAGDVEAAQAVLEAALAIPTASTDGSSTIAKHRARAAASERQGRAAEALEAADAVVDMIARTMPTGYYWVDYLATAVEVYLAVASRDASADRRRLDRRIRQGCALLKRLSRTFGNVKPRALLLDGMRLARDGAARKAIRAYRNAKELAIAMRMPFEEARASAAIAAHDPPGDAAAERARATAIFERLGALHHLHRLQSAS